MSERGAPLREEFAAKEQFLRDGGYEHHKNEARRQTLSGALWLGGVLWLWMGLSSWNESTIGKTFLDFCLYVALAICLVKALIPAAFFWVLVVHDDYLSRLAKKEREREREKLQGRVSAAGRAARPRNRQEVPSHRPDVPLPPQERRGSKGPKVVSWVCYVRYRGRPA